MPSRPHLARFLCCSVSLHADSFRNRRADNEPTGPINYHAFRRLEMPRGDHDRLRMPAAVSIGDVYYIP